MSNSTTNLHDLPTDPVSGGSVGGNVSLVATETSQYSNNIVAPVGIDNTPSSQNAALSLDQNTISQIVNGLQQASIAGMTSLPSRDIPRNTEGIISDPHVQPNYVPPPISTRQDYIRDEPLYTTTTSQNNKGSFDTLYDEIQGPLLLGILYFIFQLPAFKRFFSQYASFLFNGDGNYNIQGLFFMSALFGFIYYGLIKIMTHFSKF
jgi:hypothetical protein